MPTAIVAHRYWGSPGGGQLVSAAAATALADFGYSVHLASIFPFDKSKYVEWYGLDISKFPVSTLLPYDLKAFGVLARLYIWRPVEKIVQREGADLLFIDEPTYGPLTRRKDIKIVEYIHFPLEVYTNPKWLEMGLSGGEDPYIAERYSKFPLNIYWKTFLYLLPRYIRKNPFADADLVLTNSNWTAKVAKIVYGEEPKVLNPPIAPNVEIVKEPRPFEERRPVVVMLGRFSQEKRYHWVVAEVVPRLLREVPEAKVVIFGGAATPTQKAYMEEVRRLAERAGVAKAMELRPSAPRSEINIAMDEARVFLHATINEHWGIAVAEAMARGLPIVVHKSGGAWSDLAGQGATGLGYEGVDEAVEQMAKLMTDSRIWSRYSTLSIEKVKDLSINNFANKLYEYLKDI
ncbi:MAG: glycosyltransferase [Thermoproteus sp.]